MKPIIFLRIAWMIDYQGVTDLDKPNGAGSYVKENKDGGEVANFFPVNGKYYGYARIRNGNDLRIERLGAKKSNEFIDNVTVVFFSTNPFFGGQYVVGWYDDAVLYRSIQTLKNGRKGHHDYLAVTDKRKGTLLPVAFRKFEIPIDGPGQTNAWYVMEYSAKGKFLSEFEKFKRDPKKYKRVKKVKLTNKKGWQLDAELRKKIEVAAMDATANHFEEMGFHIKYVHLNKLGWDLEAEKKNIKLRLEVKGTSSDLQSVELTPNEFMHSKSHSNYRICILENALNKKLNKLHICQLRSNRKIWVSDLGDQLKIVPITSAQLRRITCD